ncbi:MAG: type II toxin-antitoxin system HipA family toxin [Deltaproteobacteria bacterium]|nr:type II toxin-antitoxin system HipA family toxin [Deltaproteobacteria bacterium]
MNELIVWWGARRVGRLTVSSDDRLAFRYAAATTARDRISASLPVDPTRDQPGTFFSNLLPDGALRDRLAHRLGVSPGNDFAMLAAVGGDCAGALSLLPPGVTPGEEGGRRALTAKALQRALELGAPEVMAGEGLRLSLAGAQDKLPVIADGGKLFLPEGATASTHILKLPSARFRGIAENEWLMLSLAQGVGLATVAARLWPLPGQAGSALLVDRFDRRAGARLHQEDLCQALGRAPSRKYEADGGPSLADVIRLLSSESTQPATDIEKVIRWQAFSALAGNADGHAKNLALVRHEGQVTLAPFYDLVCTRQWAPLSTRLAFAVGGMSDPGQIGGKHWKRAAQEWEVSPAYVLETVRRTNAALKKALVDLPARALEAGIPETIVRSIVGIVRKVSRRSETLLREG